MRAHSDSIVLDTPVSGASSCDRGEVVERLGVGALAAPDAAVMQLQAAMMAMPEHHIQIEPRHTFAHGLYAREVTLPEGSVAVGHRHAQEHIVILSRGRVLVVTEAGTQEIAAPATMVVPAGRKNCVHALEETVWTTIHASPAATPDEAERSLILPDDDMPCLSGDPA